MRQTHPGDEIVDLRNVLEEVERINDLDPQDASLDDIEYLADVQDLEDQLWTNLEDYARNEPVMIKDSYFEEYAEELASDLGFVSRESLYDWPNNCIDWKEAAEQLKCDYHEVSFGDYVYFVRSW